MYDLFTELCVCVYENCVVGAHKIKNNNNKTINNCVGQNRLQTKIQRKSTEFI